MHKSNRGLTVREFLVLVLTASRDAGYPTVERRKVAAVLWSMRDRSHPLIPRLTFDHSQGQSPASCLIDRGIYTLHQHGVEVDANFRTINVWAELSLYEVLKPYYDREREELLAFSAEFVRLLTTSPS